MLICAFEHNFHTFSLQAWVPWIPAKPFGLALLLVHIIFIMFVLNWLFVLFSDCIFFLPSSSLLHILGRQYELERAWIIPKLSKTMSLKASLIKASCFTVLYYAAPLTLSPKAFAAVFSEQTPFLKQCIWRLLVSICCALQLERWVSVWLRWGQQICSYSSSSSPLTFLSAALLTISFLTTPAGRNIYPFVFLLYWFHLAASGQV